MVEQKVQKWPQNFCVCVSCFCVLFLHRVFRGSRLRSPPLQTPVGNPKPQLASQNPSWQVKTPYPWRVLNPTFQVYICKIWPHFPNSKTLAPVCHIQNFPPKFLVFIAARTHFFVNSRKESQETKDSFHADWHMLTWFDCHNSKTPSEHLMFCSLTPAILSSAQSPLEALSTPWLKGWTSIQFHPEAFRTVTSFFRMSVTCCRGKIQKKNNRWMARMTFSNLWPFLHIHQCVYLWDESEKRWNPCKSIEHAGLAYFVEC